MMQSAYSIYNLIVISTFNAIRLIRRFAGGRSGRAKSDVRKIDRFIGLQSECVPMLARIPEAAPGQKTIWFHASSLGEYQIARPMIPLLKKRDCRIVFTFFSSTAIDALDGKEGRPDTPDIILPLPLDTQKNTENFIRRIRPDEAVFMVSEYWPNYLRELERNDIPTLLYGAFFRKDRGNSVGNRFRDLMVRKFSVVAVNDRESEESLQAAGCRKVVRVADPLFDNALSKRDEYYSDGVLERFCRDTDRVLVAGSLHLDKDLELIAAVAARYPDSRLIIVPHEITREALKRISSTIPGRIQLHSEAAANGLADDTDRIVIDSVGALAKIYRYGTAAYVGGGFTRYLHSVIEPMVYGIPVAFGPVTGRKYVTHIMEDAGIGTKVADGDEICRWWGDIRSGKTDLGKVRTSALSLCESNRGGAAEATELILKLSGR